MRKLFMVLFLSLICATCSAQLVFNGVLQLGKINTVNGVGGTYDPSNEFNSLDWPSGYAFAFDNAATFTGTAMRFDESNTGLVTLASPQGDWQMDIKLTPAGDIAYSGVTVNGWYFAVDMSADPVFYLGKDSATQTETLTIDAAYLRVTKVSTALTFEYSTDGSTYYELEPDSEESTSPEAPTEAGTLIELETTVGAGTASAELDYIRFTEP